MLQAIHRHASPSLRMGQERRMWQAGSSMRPALAFAWCSTAAKAEKKEKAAAISKTLLLPKTSFSMRANARQREPQLLSRCSSSLYAWQSAQEDRQPWTLHDGPPYANGVPHVGHALNKILKDVINRWKVLTGHRVSYVPGWDCHGLPIEIKALQELKAKEKQQKEKDGEGVEEGSEAVRTRGLFVRRKAKQVAESAVKKQKKCFEGWGVMGDWQNAYKTLEPAYEAAQLRVFHDLWRNGVIYKGRKPVHWSPSSRTALAEAELEYPPAFTSRSVFVRFPAQPDCSVATALKEAIADPTARALPLALLVWTTTPWTLPANMGACVLGSMEYVLVREAERLLVVAKERLEYVESMLGAKLEVVGEVTGEAIVGLRYGGLMREGKVYDAPFVTAASGTGVVHAAPGHGQDDFQLLSGKHGVEAHCPVDDDGCYTADVGDAGLVGLSVLGEGNAKVLEMLEARELLAHAHDYEHKYPHDWRTGKPVILRATEQWFADVRQLIPKALEAIEGIEMIPGDVNRQRLASFLQARNDWCISRQRAWGVPIPVFYDTETHEPLLSSEVMQHVADTVEKKGADCWWHMDVADLLPESVRSNGRSYYRKYDTVDVWFDSGSSWRAVLEERQLPMPADMYLEGSDQHRGWFQSSLLTAIGVRGVAPYKRLVTHGFVLDEEGKKMSKSLGNVVDPQVIVLGGKDAKKQPAYGADVLRMWAASADYSKDVNIGDKHIVAAFETLKKIRNTVRFLLGNLQHFREPLAYEDMCQVDQFLLGQVRDAAARTKEHYDAFQINKVMLLLQQFCTAELSSFYFEAVKDRLYADAVDSKSRRSAETALAHTLEFLTKALAPVAAFTAEDIFEHTPDAVKAVTGVEENQGSVFQAGWMDVPAEWDNKEVTERWQAIRTAKSTCNTHLEELRRQKTINSSIEAQLTIRGDPSASPLFASLREAEAAGEVLHLALGVSSVTLETETTGSADLGVTAAPSEAAKCVRCWLHTAPQEADSDGSCLCSRCAPLI